jgi:hypothetical protein
MRQRFSLSWIALTLTLGLGIGSVLAHITPPVVLLSEQDAVRGMTGGATKFFVREVKLTAEERGAIRQQWGWQAENELYRFYLGRDAAGQLVAAVIFLTEFTIHGPVRVAVGLNPDGTVKDAKVVELTEETLPWLQVLLNQNLLQDYVGRDSRGNFALGERFAAAHIDSMPQFYGQIVTSLMQRGAILFEVTVLKRPGKV